MNNPGYISTFMDTCTSTIKTSLLSITLLFTGICFGVIGCVEDQSKSQAQSQSQSPSSSNNPAYAIAIHGGAGTPDKNMPEALKEQYKAGLRAALQTGENILENGGTALDAVEASIRILEDDSLFNAGKGAVFTHQKENELDAAIMDGNSLSAGAITGVKTVKNPISLARKVMTDSRHVFFSWSGAEKFADQFDDIERVNPAYFKTRRRLKSLERALGTSAKDKDKNRDVDHDHRLKFGTVGCVALDKEGKLAAGTSTGGMTNKMFGRVGDVPIIGAGTYADSLVAVSATGWGEKIMLNVTSHTVSAYMDFKNAPLNEAANYVIQQKMETNTAGIITVDKNGNISMPFNTTGMFRAAADANGSRTVKIWE